MRIILGDFDFNTLHTQNTVLGPIYFISYVFFAFFVLLNMFLAIINDTYSDVKSDIEVSKSEFELGDYFKQNYERLLAKMHLKQERIVEIQMALSQADKDNNKQVNFDEWKSELRVRASTFHQISLFVCIKVCICLLCVV